MVYVEQNQSRVVNSCSLKITDHSLHEYLELNFYEQAPCQVVGTIHSCIYKFEFNSEKDQPVDLKTYVERYSKYKLDDVTEYLSNEGNHGFEVISEAYHQITGKEPEVVCISPQK